MNVDKLKWTIIIIFIIFIALAILAVLSWNNRRSSDGTGNHFDRAYELVQGTPAEARVFGRSDESILSDKYRPLASLFESASGLKPSVHNDIEIITEGKRKYDLLIEDIQNAKESIHMEYFHFGIDKGSRAIRKALIDKAKQGVKVRFIYDNIANIPIPPVYFWSMRFAGDPLDETSKAEVMEVAGGYGLEEDQISIKDYTRSAESNDIELFQEIYRRNEEQIASKDQEIRTLGEEVKLLKDSSIPHSQIAKEIFSIYPSVLEISLSRGKTVNRDLTESDVLMVNLHCNQPLSEELTGKMKEWLKIRLEIDNVLISHQTIE